MWEDFHNLNANKNINVINYTLKINNNNMGVNEKKQQKIHARNIKIGLAYNDLRNDGVRKMKAYEIIGNKQRPKLQPYTVCKIVLKINI